MVGKAGYKKKDGTQYRNYWCSRAQKSRAACSTYNGHSVAPLEKAILEHLGKFTDPKLAREHLATAKKRDVTVKSKELDRVEKAMAGVAGDFLRHLELHKQKILNDEEFRVANESLRSQKDVMEARRAELDAWVVHQSDKAEVAALLPAKIRSFIEDFGVLDVRQQKAHLQTILSAAQIHRDGTIELEFRV